MVRISDFIFPTTHPPKTITKPFTKQLVQMEIPGKNGLVVQDLGSKNMRIALNGGLYNIPSDTDKRHTDMNELMTLAMANNPMTFTHDGDHPCGADGDNWSEYADVGELTVDWSPAGLSMSVESSVKKFGSYGIKLTSIASGTMKLDNISGLNLNLPEYSALCFWLRTTSAVATDDDITIKCETDDSNFRYQIIDASTDFVANTWTEIILPVGSGASTSTDGVDGWFGVLSPDWTDINSISLMLGASASGTIYIDGFCLTHAVVFEGFPQYSLPAGNPNRYDYNIQLLQYLQ